MNIIDIAVEVIFLSASGVLSPGPLFLANIIYGSRKGLRSGIKFASGHAIVEFPLIVFISLGIFGLSPLTLTNESLRIIGLVGGIAIIFFSISQINSIIKGRSAGEAKNKNVISDHFFFRLSKSKDRGRRLGGPFVLGLVFSALNPFFIFWWFTVGLKLISDSVYLFGIVEGTLILFTLHIWMDYAWLGSTAYIVSKGRSLLKERLYRYFLLSISFILASYGLYLLIQSVSL